ncbi:hypothetical protein ABT324_28020 [Saccharopolyspora sp. NPDC000359]|uniref:hypothetical protein n=1 Tax=Saccharopolyspora sp. NPDC000359 TaxID=3154251 RepID=UPI00332B471D
MIGSTIDWVEVDRDMVEVLMHLEQVPAFADELADHFAEDFCRSVDSVEEIYERQVLAGVALAPVITLPIPASQLRPPELQRAAA